LPVRAFFSIMSLRCGLNGFVTRKIVNAACRIGKGSGEKLHLGNISIARDWGWAPEYVTAMWLMLQQETAEDYVIATGERNTLENFVAEAFGYFDLDWHDHVISDSTLLRPSEIMVSCGDPVKAWHRLGWQAAYKMRDVVRMMVEAQLQSLQK